jgi:hypothetical protein
VAIGCGKLYFRMQEVRKGGQWAIYVDEGSS